MSTALRKQSSESWLDRAITEESWDYIECETQGLTHNIHRYSGKFIPQIAARVINTLSVPGDLVLDPYCGSGTVLVEAALNGRRGLGIDLNPLAVLIAQTKICPIPHSALATLRKQMAETVGNLTTSETQTLFNALPAKISDATDIIRQQKLSDSWFCKWFSSDVLRDLAEIESAIQRLEDRNVRNVALVAFSDILRKSSNAHSGYPNVMFDKNAPKKPRPGKPYLRALERVCAMIDSLASVSVEWGDVGAKRGTATATGLDANSIDLIVTHPPYIGSIPYAEYGALSLKWLGVDPKVLDQELTGGRRQTRDVVDRFEEAYGQMLMESYRVLKNSKYAFLMVGNPVVRGDLIDLAAMTIELAERAGFSLAARTERRAINRRANKMGGEHLLFFQKKLRKTKALHGVS